MTPLLPLYRERQAAHLLGGTAPSGAVLLVPSKGQVKNPQLQREMPLRAKQGGFSTQSWGGAALCQRLCVAFVHLPHRLHLSWHLEVTTGMHIDGFI